MCVCVCVCVCVYIIIFVSLILLENIPHTLLGLNFLFNKLLQWGKKVFSQPPIVQVLPLKKMRDACNFHHRYTSTMRDKIRKKNPENHIVGFLKNLFANYGGN